MNVNEEEILNGVLDQFAVMCRYPHPSWSEGPLADYVENLLRERGLSPIRDEWNNIMADVPAAPGREGAPLVMIQGHLDMVCAVKPGSGYVPAASPVVCMVEEGLLRSDGNSSLGADNNLGNAAALWLLGQGVPHGPIRLLFTVAEEVGLQGAKRVDSSWLAGVRYLLNTDGFMLGKAIISSAGGYRERFTRPLETIQRKNNALFSLKLTGFPGGHSGYDIHRSRSNPIRLAAQFLSALADCELLDLSGGHADNAIPMDCTALLAVNEEAVPGLEQAAEDLAREIPDGTVSLNRVEQGPETAWSADCRNAVLHVLTGVFVGVYAWRDREKEQVSASANLGTVRVKDGQIEVACFIRASRQEDERILAQQHFDTAQKVGFQGSADGYPGWPEREENPLVNAVANVWKELTGRDMVIESVHVGLEPSVLGAKNPEMLMVNTGPEIWDPHSLDERAPVEGLPDYVRLLAGTLDVLSKG